ncbi:MAG: pentapeptide repeat-containing protein [Smithella sp.]
MKHEIKSMKAGHVLFALDTASFRLCVEAAVKSGSDLSGSDLSGADLSGADLSGADLRGSDLRGSVLSGSDLRGSDLSGSNIDFSSGFSFKCTSFNIKIDLKIAAQLAYHFCRMDCDAPEFITARNALVDLGNKFHRVEECGKLEGMADNILKWG